jgi:hypothetical protein
VQWALCPSDPRRCRVALPGYTYAELGGESLHIQNKGGTRHASGRGDREFGVKCIATKKEEDCMDMDMVVSSSDASTSSGDAVAFDTSTRSVSGLAIPAIRHACEVARSGASSSDAGTASGDTVVFAASPSSVSDLAGLSLAFPSGSPSSSLAPCATTPRATAPAASIPGPPSQIQRPRRISPHYQYLPGTLTYAAYLAGRSRPPGPFFL